MVSSLTRLQQTIAAGVLRAGSIKRCAQSLHLGVKLLFPGTSNMHRYDASLFSQFP